MTQKNFWHAVLIIVLCAALATPAKANSLDSDARNIAIGIVAATAAVAVVVTLVVIHYSKKRTITGCVKAGENGMTVTDDKDKQIYALSGNIAGVTSGDRMKLQGKKVKSKNPDKSVMWVATNVTKDFGVCQP